jgi:hypothetical protein
LIWSCSNEKSSCYTGGFFYIKTCIVYLTGAVRSLLTRKITAINPTTIANIPGIPTSSAKPVFGRAVDVGMIVCVDAAI